MAGVLTMSATVEDYNIPPCKKLRKDEDPPSKTITNYFSPVSRNTEKVFSSPRSSNITDYFKKTSPASYKEKTTSSKIKCNVDKQTEAINEIQLSPTLGSSKAASKLKKRGKRINLSRRLSDLNQKSETDVTGEIDDNEKDTVEDIHEITSFMGSDTAALLAEICSNKEDLDNQEYPEKSISQTEDRMAKKSQTDKKNCSKRRKRKRDQDTEVHTNIEINEEIEDPGTFLESKSTLGDSSLDVNVGESSCGNDSVEIVSFEDFVKSREEKDADDDVPECSFKTDNQENAASELSNKDYSQEPSPKTVTVHAQVHLSPPLHNSFLQKDTAPKKIAAIFIKKKDEKKIVEISSIVQEPGDQIIQKRKSNVVISEDELELAVLETENVETVKHKSTTEERQQFMKAFKQPTDVVKNGGKKCLSKQKDSHDQSKEVGHGPCTDLSEESSVTLVNEESQEIFKECKPGKAKKLKRTVKEQQTANLNTPIEKSRNRKNSKPPKNSERCKPLNTNDKEVSEPPVTSVSPGLRRSSRYQKSENSAGKSAAKCVSNIEDPVQMSTPKVKTSSRKNDIYRVEVLSNSPEVQSPIRMRFTRLSARRRGRPSSLLEGEVFTPRSTKDTGSTKKIKKAKQLIEKAKAIQQNISKTETPKRRSSRQPSLKKNISEDCVIVVENSPDKNASSKQITGKKTLRSLNDVLGKRAKETKSVASAGQMKASEKRLKKPSHITIIDDSSLEASENSQDDEQFKSKREFLMSGLPDSLKRHIAKSAAIIEAYSLLSSSFQNVVHVQQKDDCLMWNLVIPSCPLITGMDWSTTLSVFPKLTLSLGEFTDVTTKQPSIRLHENLLNRRREEFSESVQECLLEEISSANPQFPVKKFFKQFLKRQRDQLTLQETTKEDDTLVDKSINIVNNNEKQSQGELFAFADCEDGTKRKKKDSPAIKLKRKKSANIPGDGDTVSCISEANQTRKMTRGQLSRASRKKQEKEVLQVADVNYGREKSLVSADVYVEDVLWTEKYQPQNSNEMIGNTTAIKKLHSWLKEWKVRAEKEEKRNQMQKTEKDKESGDHGDFLDDSSDSEEESLCNTVLITGPSGVGKTAAVYACALELGFKVFEVNASCQRSGRQILAQLKEATQSHQVDQQGVNAHKPCFFNSCSGTKSPRKLSSPRKVVVSSPRKPPASPRGMVHKKGLAPKSLANFFQGPSKNEVKTKVQEISKSAAKMKSDVVTESKRNKLPVAERGHGSEESHRKTATSLILFEEVDVIFDDDSGFLAAIKTFMTTTKRPVILTTNGPWEGEDFLHLKLPYYPAENETPSLPVAQGHTERLLLCLQAHGWKVNMKKNSLVLAVRVNLLNTIIDSVSMHIYVKDQRRVKLQMMACRLLQSNAHPSCKISQAEDWSKIVLLLSEFQRKKVDFVSSNLEFLLPLSIRFLEPKKSTLPENLDSVLLTTQIENTLEESPIKISAQMKRRKKMLLLNDSDLFESDCNSAEEFLSLPCTNTTQRLHEENKIHKKTPLSLKKRKLTSAEQKSSNQVFQSLNTIAEFVDNMSYLDCCTYTDNWDKDHFYRYENYNWTESKIKNGLCDGRRVESNDWWSAHSCCEVKAGIEAFAFKKCSNFLKAINTTLDLCKDSEPTEELTIQVSKHRDELLFEQSSPFSITAEKRLSLVRTVLSNRSFINLGNRPANVTEYLPALRAICKLEKLKEQGKTKRRFLHYFEGIHLELPKATMNSLAEDFP
ncbi:ATPase family AAA domain-containing protein 5 [Bombina bombina]|uniref:ATPase family AAA domain-containing protein 5 n=1 Tax=Bombina bombina TaxID=8345 RepID=UPI00235A9718|nr:ATPase family AAA domain-containing protein 5 [Bombina bombina]